MRKYYKGGPSVEAYLRYYRQQKGGALPYFHGDIYGQRGAGFGSVFAKLLGGIRGLISKTPDWVKTGVSEAAKQAARTGMEIVGEAGRAKTKDEWQRAAKTRLKEGTGNLLMNLGNRLKSGQQQQGSGIRKRRGSIMAIVGGRNKRRRKQIGKGIKKRRKKTKKQTGKGIKRRNHRVPRKQLKKKQPQRRRRRQRRQRKNGKSTSSIRTKLDFLGN
jgi:hypothetical protein